MKKKESILRTKSYKFSIEIVNTYKAISKEKKEFVISKQLLRSGTSIGANIREAEFAQSRKDFIHKMSISLKESGETDYWLSILKDTKYLSVEDYKKLSDKNDELLKMLVSTINTMKSKT